MKAADQLQFASREAFRAWLGEHGQRVPGVWLVFGKKGGPQTLSASEALEEALCFGWIDGQMKSIDAQHYLKYFAPRRKGSVWSEKNKGLIATLEQQGKMTEHGRAKVEEAKQHGTWDAPKPPPLTEAEIAQLANALNGHEPAYTNFLAKPPSVRKTYTMAYLAPASEETRAKRLAQIIERLNQNLNPM